MYSVVNKNSEHYILHIKKKNLNPIFQHLSLWYHIGMFGSFLSWAYPIQIHTCLHMYTIRLKSIKQISYQNLVVLRIHFVVRKILFFLLQDNN